jgi:hypothetical protein
MNSDTTNPTWKPTLTLARLFEEQNQFYDALAIYEIISQTDQSPQIREKIEALQARILDDPNMRYDPRIEKLFSSEELAYLKILNHSAFENLSRMQSQFSKGVSDYEILLQEQAAEENPQEESIDLENVLGEIDSQAVQEAETARQEMEGLTVEDLAEELANRFGKDSRLQDISVQDFMQLLKKYNLLTSLNRK